MDFPDFIWIRNEAQQRKPIRHHFPVLRTGYEWLLRTPFIKGLCRTVYPWFLLRCSIAPPPVMNQDMGSQIPWDQVSGRKMNLHHQASAVAQPTGGDDSIAFFTFRFSFVLHDTGGTNQFIFLLCYHLLLPPSVFSAP